MTPMAEEPTFIIRLCSDKAAYEAVPKKRLRADLMKVKRALQRRGDSEIVLWTPQLMVVRRKDATEITIVDDGRLIIRNVTDGETARRIAEALLHDLKIGNY